MALRISHDKLDNELRTKINSAKLEMGRVGIKKFDDDLAYSCIEMYVKSTQNFEGEGARYQNRFEDMRNALSLSSAYNSVGDSVEK